MAQCGYLACFLQTLYKYYLRNLTKVFQLLVMNLNFAYSNSFLFDLVFSSSQTIIVIICLSSEYLVLTQLACINWN